MLTRARVALVATPPLRSNRIGAGLHEFDDAMPDDLCGLRQVRQGDRSRRCWTANRPNLWQRCDHVVPTNVDSHRTTWL